MDQFKSKVIKEPKPVLLSCLKQGIDFIGQLIVLEDIQDFHKGTLKVYFLDPDGLQTFAQEFSVKGTPTHCLFYKGKIVDRFLGQADYKDLDKFLSRILISTK
ncbi:MAG: hypothetical protein C0407_06935 [Desulfobacca sp.]|nr:hypothetical protein [Desulfobacca sp.]